MPSLSHDPKLDNFYHHIINVCFHIYFKLAFNILLTRIWYITPKFFNLEGILILRMHSNIVMTLISIKKAHKAKPNNGINQLVNARQRKIVFKESIINICESYAHSRCTIRLLHQYNIRTPHQIIHFLNYFGFLQSYDLISYDLILLSQEPSLPLFHRIYIRIDIKHVVDNLEVNFYRIFRPLGKLVHGLFSFKNSTNDPQQSNF